MKKYLLTTFALMFSTTVFANKNIDNEYVGTESCVSCHTEQVEDWKDSDHDKAMDHATNDSVLGDFSGQTVKFEKRKAKFFKKDNKYFVEIIELDQNLLEVKEAVEVSYTFGHDPLQQYMVEFEDGRIQLLPFSWDSRKKSEGGQKWFDLYPDTTKTDTFYWKNTGQNWNFMCADCHSTDVKKGYDKKNDTYNTTWKEINVGCEACHGKGKNHVELMNDNKDIKSLKSTHYGFEKDLSKSVKEWTFKEGSSTLHPKEIFETDQVDTCVQCHSRRLQINEDNDIVKGDIFDKYIVSNITQELYHPDGMIYDENYVYGSFEQSKMAESGVTCTNCHDPHKAELKIPKEAVCAQCHLPTEYNQEKHTFHNPNKEGGQCVDCHMPETTYMKVDPRRDHSWHVPSPKKSAVSGSPDVCTSCHEGETQRWADEKINTWYPNRKEELDNNTPAIVFGNVRNGQPNMDDELSHVAQNKNNADIIRASALERLQNYPSQNAYITLIRAIKDKNSQVRFSAAQGSANMPLEAKLRILNPLLVDPVLAVRTEAVSQLVRHWNELSLQQKNQLKSPLAEYIKIQEFNSDRAFGRTNLGNIYFAKGEVEKAITEYEGSIQVEPYYENAYPNLSSVYASIGQNEKSRKVLEQGVENNPKSPTLHYSLAMNYLQSKDKEKAIYYLGKALEINKNNAQYWYVLGLVFEEVDITKSISSLNNAYSLTGNPQYLYSKCEISYRNKVSEPESCFNELSKYVSKQEIEAIKNKYK